MKKIITTLVLLGCCSGFSHFASANDNKVKLMEKVVSAYGGEMYGPPQYCK